MATNEIFRYSPEKTRVRAVPNGTDAGVPLLINTRPAVTITAEGGKTKSSTVGSYTITGPSGGVGLADDEATVAFDGTWEFTSITGVTTSTGQDVAIYITGAGALTTTSSGNTLYGYTDYPKGYVKATGKAPVRIGD